MTKLTIFFSGTEMTWEDTALFLQLGAKKRHNLRKIKANHYFYFFDGVAASSSPEHQPVEQLSFDEKNKDFTKSTPRKHYSKLQYLYNFIHGSGMNHILETAFNLVNFGIKKGIEEFDLIGFSRGGSIALTLGALIKELHLPKNLIDKIKFNIFAIDPVAGLSRNASANQYGTLSSMVKTCIIGLATEESLPGFKPRDKLSKNASCRINFDPHTKFLFLPFPEDHLMNNFWMQDIIKKHIPNGSELLKPCDERYLIERKIGINGVQWNDRFGATSAYRMVHYFKDEHSAMPRYSHHVFPLGKKHKINIKKGVEDLFKYSSLKKFSNGINHNSLQNDADSEIKNRFYEKDINGNVSMIKIEGAHPHYPDIQRFNYKKNHNTFFRLFGFRNRNVNENLSEYTNLMFVNLLHEAMFQICYPNLHRFLQTWDSNLKKKAIEELEKISIHKYYYTRESVIEALNACTKLKMLNQFESTNLKSLPEIFKLSSNTDGLQIENKLNYFENVTHSL